MKTYTVNVSVNGSTEWYLDGKLHREDGPAVTVRSGGTFYEEWYINGELHRKGGPAIEYKDGTKCWFLDGKRHREDGPACEFVNGTKKWYIHGKRHREDGPAVISTEDGTKQWWIDGESISQEKFNKLKAKELTVAEVEKLLGHKVKIIK